MAVPECVHCGFCLPVCPTYDVLGTEMDNPRGRLYLMRALEEGRVDPNASLVRHLDLCLGCRACESECPSGVPYGHHLEEARARLRTSPARRWSERFLEGLILHAVALPPSVQRLGAILHAALHRVVRRATDEGGASGERSIDDDRAPVGRAVGEGGAGPGSGASAGHPSRLRQIVSLLAAVEPRAASLPPVVPARPEERRGADPRGERSGRPSDATRSRLRAGFLEGCVNRWVFGHVNAAAAKLIADAGCEVVAPAGQRCCGALHLHAGDREGAKALARRNIESFEAAGRLDAIVVTAAGCGAAMKEYGALFAGDAEWEARARRFSEKACDALVLLARLRAGDGIDRQATAAVVSVAYHDACHLAHAQGIRAEPRALLSSIPGLRLVPLADADRCCGSAGIYNVLHPEVASSVLEAKLDRLRASGAQIVAAANPGCLMQLAAGVRAAGLPIRVAHPVELIEEHSMAWSTPARETLAAGEASAIAARDRSILP